MNEKRSMLKYMISTYSNVINNNVSIDELNDSQINSVDVNDLLTLMQQKQTLDIELLFSIQKKEIENSPSSPSNLSWPSPGTPQASKKALPLIPKKKELPKIPTKFQSPSPSLGTPTPVDVVEDTPIPMPSRAAPKTKMTEVFTFFLTSPRMTFFKKYPEKRSMSMIKNLMRKNHFIF
jgi:hypothetical protein